MIFLQPPAPCPPYSSLTYDRFWAEAQDLDMTLVLHENTGGGETRLSPSSYWDEHMSLGSITRPHEVQRTLGMIILSGVLERFPNLRFVSAENGTDWLPWFIHRVERARYGSYPTKLALKPIEYLQRQVSFTYIDEPEAVANRDVVGVDRLMFSTDYPHSASTWPHSREIVERDMMGVSEADRRKIVRDNVLRIFNVKVPVAV
jgi:predicted TIM-barrel fold metal-dependent hydrolase